MIFQIAFILVAIAIFSTVWAILEILFLEIFLTTDTKSSRSKSVQKRFDR